MGNCACGFPPPFGSPLPPLHTPTYPFARCRRTGQGQEEGAAQGRAEQGEVLLFHLCNWGRRDTQCTMGDLGFPSRT